MRRFRKHAPPVLFPPQDAKMGIVGGAVGGAWYPKSCVDLPWYPDSLVPSLPLCRPKYEELVQKFPSLGEALQGDELTAHNNVKPRGCSRQVQFPQAERN